MAGHVLCRDALPAVRVIDQKQEPYPETGYVPPGAWHVAPAGLVRIEVLARVKCGTTIEPEQIYQNVE